MADMKGKLIYQLTSAEALKDTDLFAISTSDNLTRSISLSQIKLSFRNIFYDKQETDELLDGLREQIKSVVDNALDLNNDITEFRNEFNLKLQELNQTLIETINIVDKESLDRDTALGVRIDNLNTKVDNSVNTLNTRITNEVNTLNNTITALDTELTNKIDSNYNTLNTRITNEVGTLNTTITELDDELTNKINGLISYGTTVPTTLETGKLYLQYF